MKDLKEGYSSQINIYQAIGKALEEFLKIVILLSGVGFVICSVVLLTRFISWFVNLVTNRLLA